MSLFNADRLRGAWLSLTIWANTFLLSVLAFYEVFKDDIELLKPYLPEDVFHRLSVIIIVVNMVLRFRTTKDLAHK